MSILNNMNNINNINNKGKASILEILNILGIFMFLVVPAVLFHQYWLAGVFVVFGLCFGLIEFLADKFTGSTVSQKFWGLIKENKKKAIIILGSMLIAWILLLLHLGSKL